MAGRVLAYRKLRRRGVPGFMGRARVLVYPRTRAARPDGFFSDEMAGGARPVVMTQQGVYWCWAAVLQGLLALDGKYLSQQDITNRHTGEQCPITASGSPSRTACTKTTGCELPCDGPHNLRLAMEGWHYQPNYIRGDDPQLLATLTASLASQPVAARVGFTSVGGGHSILITGFSGQQNNPMIEYFSPIHYQGTPYPVQPKAVAWTSLTGGFWLDGNDAQLSHIYPKV